MNSERLPFIIGVTGHRDLLALSQANQDISENYDSQSEIKDAFMDCLYYWRKQLGNSTPIWVFCGMAEGADLLAIECVEELIASKEEEWANGLLNAYPCLPMPYDYFKRDFTGDSEGLSKLNHALKTFNENIFVVSNGLNQKQYEEAVLDNNYGELRNSLYLNCGLFIAKYCNVLIALWDGCKSAGTGGTADIVAYKCGQAVEWPTPNQSTTSNASLSPESGFDGYVGGLVQHIPVTRKKRRKLEPNKASEFVALNEVPLSQQRNIVHYTCLKHTSKYDSNKTISQLIANEHGQLLSDLAKYNNKLSTWKSIEQKNDNSTQTPGLSKGLGNFIFAFKKADNIALEVQTLYRRRMQWFAATAFSGLFFYELVSNYLGSSAGLGMNAWILCSVLIAWVLIVNARKTQNKWYYQCFRGVAEAMRVTAYLNLANVPPDAKPLLPRRYRQRFPLINHAARCAELHWWKVSPTQTNDRNSHIKQDLQAVKSEWLEGQLCFLKSRLADSTGIAPWRILSLIKAHLYGRPKLAQMRFSSIASFFFYVALAAGLVLLVLQLSSFYIKIEAVDTFFAWAMLTIQMSLLVGATSALWEELANYKMTYQGYEDLASLYERALVLINDEHLSNTKNMLSELAREAMQEHAQWHHFESQSDIEQR